MVRTPFYDKNGLKKGAWSTEEDNKLRAYIQKSGHPNWRKLPKSAGTKADKNNSRSTFILNDIYYKFVFFFFSKKKTWGSIICG